MLPTGGHDLPIRPRFVRHEQMATSSYIHMGISINGSPIDGWFISWKILLPTKMDDLGVLPFWETSISSMRYPWLLTLLPYTAPVRTNSSLSSEGGQKLGVATPICKAILTTSRRLEIMSPAAVHDLVSLGVDELAKKPQTS